MTVAVINDLFWGDCGKGLAVGTYSPTADIIVRYNGGRGAGHSQLFHGKELNYHQIPSALHLGKTCVMANGVVFDPEGYFEELDDLRCVYPELSTDTLYLSSRAHVTMPWHRAIEAAEELEAAVCTGKRIGTTRKSIGPTYSDKYTRHYAIRVEDLIDPDKLAKKVRRIVPVKQGILDFYRAYINEKLIGSIDIIDESDLELIEKPLNADRIIEYYKYLGKKVKESLTVLDTVRFLNDAIERGEKILFEGAQGCGIDIDHGTDYPNCTSSNTTTGAVCSGAGISPDKITKRIGVVKVYCSRVGSGIFPTQIGGELEDILRMRGKEFGRATGRPRRVGWLDGQRLKDGNKLNGYNGLVVVGMNVLAGLDELKVCTHYDKNGNPVYRPMKPWQKIQEKDVKERGIGGFPQEARDYLDLISELTNGAEIYMIAYDFGQHLKLKEIFP